VTTFKDAVTLRTQFEADATQIDQEWDDHVREIWKAYFKVTGFGRGQYSSWKPHYSGGLEITYYLCGEDSEVVLGEHWITETIKRATEIEQEQRTAALRAQMALEETAKAEALKEAAKRDRREYARLRAIFESDRLGDSYG
jgi:hypothetical protein